MSAPRIAAVCAVFFPAEPESRVCDLLKQASEARRPGMKLYTNGRQFALLAKPRSGWARFGAWITGGEA